MNWILIIILLVAAYGVYKLVGITLRKRSELKEEGEPAGIVTSAQKGINEEIAPVERVESDAATEYNAKGLGGQPLFYNEVDHSQGRFVSFFRKQEDYADERIVKNNFYRIRYLKDVTKFWFIRTSEEEETSCVFRPGIDTITKHCGEQPGIPAEGLVIIKRSMDGRNLGRGDSERYRLQLLQEKDWTKMQSDMLLQLQDRTRLQTLDPTSKEYVDLMEQLLKRTSKIHSAARSSGSSESSFGSPYANEIYGGEDTGGSPDGGSEGLWKLGN